MAQDKHVALNDAFIVTRTIPLGSGCPGSPAAAERLAEQPGVAFAKSRDDGGMEVRYDASRIGFHEIEHILDEAGLARPAGLGWRIKSEWFRFTDGNARANASATHACCSRPPVRAGGNPKK
jgi:hypothetical protein